MSSTLEKLILTNQAVIHAIKLNDKVIDRRGYLGGVIIEGDLILAGLHLDINHHGAEASMSAIGDKAKTSQLLFHLYSS